jgi:hypothetical protein
MNKYWHIFGLKCREKLVVVGTNSRIAFEPFRNRQFFPEPHNS